MFNNGVNLEENWGELAKKGIKRVIDSAQEQQANGNDIVGLGKDAITSAFKKDNTEDDVDNEDQDIAEGYSFTEGWFKDHWKALAGTAAGIGAGIAGVKYHKQIGNLFKKKVDTTKTATPVGPIPEKSNDTTEKEVEKKPIVSTPSTTTKGPEVI